MYIHKFTFMIQGQKMFLAPVDFDLAFTADRFVSPYSGSNDEFLFHSWMESGHSEMERGLGGETANTGLQTNEEKVFKYHNCMHYYDFHRKPAYFQVQ